MASAIVMIEPTELYNILNQSTIYPCLSDTNFLLLLDARRKDEYDESHVITAKRTLTCENADTYKLPYDAELECKTHVIVYDSNCHSTRENSKAVMCASVMANNGSKNPVKILRGGYEDFSAMYPFLRTQQVIYMPQELDAIKTYPCEILPGILYIASAEQAKSKFIQKELKVQCHINMTRENDPHFSEVDGNRYLQVPIDDSPNADLSKHLDEIISVIDTNRTDLNVILVWSTNGISRSAAACIAYLMSYYKWSLADAWRHVKTCKFTIRPTRSFVEQLSDYEEKINGKRITDINAPDF